MRNSFTLSFDHDVPPAAVEIVAQDLQTMKRMLVRSGRTEEVETSAPARFIRVHLPSGRVVSIARSGTMQRVTRDMLTPPNARRESAVKEDYTPTARRRFGIPDARNTELTGAMWEQRTGEGSSSSQWLWSLDGGKCAAQGLRWVFAGDSLRPFELSGRFGRSSVGVSIPGDTQSVSIESDRTDPKRQRIQLFSRSKVGDTLLNFLRNGKLLEAETATDLAARVFTPPVIDPFAAAIAGYLLLRLHDAQRLEPHLNALVEDFPDLADGPVIHAGYLMLRSPQDTEGIASLLELAIERGMPVYTEGLRMLVDGLLTLGDRGFERVRELRGRLGHVLWESPVRTLLTQADSPTPLPRVIVTCGDPL